jgi:hypothetical protein
MLYFLTNRLQSNSLNNLSSYDYGEKTRFDRLAYPASSSDNRGGRAIGPVHERHEEFP